MGKKFNPRVVDSAPQCLQCEHIIVWTSMWHHLYDNHCNCMCDMIMAKSGDYLNKWKVNKIK